jgi:hypothetical protein
MTIQHKLITDPDIHEPKGTSTALTQQVYVANGTGSGSWQDQKPAGTLTAVANKVYVTNGAGAGTLQYPAGKLYADMYIDAGVTSQTLSASSAYAKLDPGSEWTAGAYKGLTINGTDGTITLTEAGTYMISFWASFTTASIASGTTYNFKFAINGTTTPRIMMTQKHTAGSDVLVICAQGLATVSANDVLSIYVAGDATSSGTTITVKEAGLTAIRLSE